MRLLGMMVALAVAPIALEAEQWSETDCEVVEDFLAGPNLTDFSTFAEDVRAKASELALAARQVSGEESERFEQVARDLRHLVYHARAHSFATNELARLQTLLADRC